jgi:hypothetical protein
MKTRSLPSVHALVTARRSLLPHGAARKSPSSAIVVLSLVDGARFMRASYGPALHIVRARDVTLCGRSLNAQYAEVPARSARAGLVCCDCARLAANRHLLHDGTVADPEPVPVCEASASEVSA